MAVRGFVCGNGLREAVCTIIGDVHLDAAKVALEASRNSTMPRDRINSVITHLEAAHVSYARIHGNRGYVERNAGWLAIVSSASKDVWICCLMALCYAWLGDPKMVDHSITLANRAFINKNRLYNQKFSNAADFLASLALTTMSLFDITALKAFDKSKLIAEDDFKQFRDCLNKTINQQ